MKLVENDWNFMSDDLMKDFTPKSNIEDLDSVALVQITSLWAQSIWTFINGF